MTENKETTQPHVSMMGSDDMYSQLFDDTLESAIPLTRLRKIVRIALSNHVGTENEAPRVAKQAAQMIGRATELFIENLVWGIWEQLYAENRHSLQYDDIADAIANNEFGGQFLKDVVPQRLAKVGVVDSASSCDAGLHTPLNGSDQCTDLLTEVVIKGSAEQR